jgi:hypothetical protein
LAIGIAFVGFFFDVVELVEHQQGFLQAFSGNGVRRLRCRANRSMA